MNDLPFTVTLNFTTFTSVEIILLLVI